MRILRLEMAGFKSFAVPEVLDFSEGVTSIVGPNGCGKSNVIDAVRWVLGTQSRKDLRMKDSTDVIFGGTQSRKASAEASVTIVFENGCGFFKDMGEEFSITRKLNQKAESTYLINGEEAKLRDIRNIFLGTGIGADGFTIMEQGKIDALLQSNPSDRRKVFEEAAGISDFRKKRAETERKLEVVAQNLERLNDRMGDAKKRLSQIKGQATRAMKFRELNDRLKIVRTSLSLKYFDAASVEREQLLEELSDVGKTEGQIQKDLTAVGMELESVSAKLNSGDEKLNGLREAMHECELAVNSGEGQRETYRARIEGLQRTAERLSADVARMEEQIEAIEKRREELAESRKQTAATLEEAEATLEALNDSTEALSAESGELEAKIKGLRESHIERIHQKNAILNEKLSLQGQAKSDAARRVRLESRAEELGSEIEELQARQESVEEKHEHDADLLKQLKNRYDEGEAKIKSFNEKLSETRKEHHTLEMHLSGTESRISHLEDIERMLEGVEQGSRELMSEDKLRERFGVAGLLAENIQADIKIAPALERALGHLSTAVVVETAEQAFDAFDYLARQEGAAATVVIREDFKAKRELADFPSGQGILGPLVKELRVGEGFEIIAHNLLADWLLVADRDVGRRVMLKHEGRYKCVTPTGEIFGQGSVSVPSSDRAGGIITQRSELERLRVEREKLLAEKERLQAAIDTMVEDAKKTNESVAALRGEIYEANVVVLEARTELTHLEKRLEALTIEMEKAEDELAELDEESGNHEERLTQIEEEIVTHDAEIVKVEGEIEAFAGERQAFEVRRKELNEELTQARINSAEIRSQLNAIQATSQELEATVKSFAQRIEGDRKDLHDGNLEIKRLEGEIDGSKQKEQELRERREQLATQVSELAGSLAEVRTANETLILKERELQQKMLTAKEGANDLKLREERLFLQMNDLRTKMMDEFDVDLDLQYRDYDPAHDNSDEADLHKEATALAQSIKKIGPVNLEAVDELEEVEARFENFSKQEKDLIHAKKALEEAIRKIEAEARKRFTKTFETVRGHFQRLFRKMFGGGSAELILLNPEDVLESGIEVMAKPPGMEPKTLSLLSGGQRTMIAVALMFGLFETSQAPFALLDEVDAALDEANVERFCTVLREYAGQSQFIIITHHKKTMTHADRLYGVTMQERGVSKKVAVDLATYEEEPVAMAS